MLWGFTSPQNVQMLTTKVSEVTSHNIKSFQHFKSWNDDRGPNVNSFALLLEVGYNTSPHSLSEERNIISIILFQCVELVKICFKAHRDTMFKVQCQVGQFLAKHYHFTTNLDISDKFSALDF